MRWQDQREPGAATTAEAMRRMRGKRNTVLGEAAQLVVKHALIHRGYHCVESIETGWKVHRVGNRITGAHPIAAVAGDFTALADGGRGVRVEVKRRDGDTLGINELEPHQQRSLTDYDRHGGLALVAWVRGGGQVAIVRWPVVGWITGHPLRWEDAVRLDREGGA